MSMDGPLARNAPCPCGSGRRYKACHGAVATDLPADDHPLDALMAEALAAQRDGRLDAAARRYERVLARDPANFDAVHMLGAVRLSQHRTDDAIALLERAAAMAPDVAAVRHNLAMARERLRGDVGAARYARWIAGRERALGIARAPLREAIAARASAPLLSILFPAWETPERWLRAALDSVLAQGYGRWELCAVDDASRSPDVARVLAEYAARDARIRFAVRERNGHISAASNDALAMARGPFVVLLDHDDRLPPHALAEVALALEARPGAALVYSDEDRIDEHDARSLPNFKPAWNPALARAQNFVSHLGVYRAVLAREVGGFRTGVEGAQDWDLMLRCTERARAEDVVHVPQVLYHWRMLPGSTARSMSEKGYAEAAQARVVAEAFAREGRAVRLTRVAAGAFLQADPVPSPAPAVTLVVVGDVDGSAARGWAAATGWTVEPVAAGADGIDDPLARDRACWPAPVAAAINAAFARARADVVAVVDASFLPPSRDALDAWAAHAMRAGVGPVGAIVVDAFDLIAGGPYVVDDGRIAQTPFRGRRAPHVGWGGRGTLVQHLAAVRGDAFAIRRELWEALGGYDAARFAGRYHDVDLGLRAAAAGARPLWHPGVVLRVPRVMQADPAAAGRDEGADARALRARHGSALVADAAYHPELTSDPPLFELPEPPAADNAAGTDRDHARGHAR